MNKQLHSITERHGFRDRGSGRGRGQRLQQSLRRPQDQDAAAGRAEEEGRARGLLQERAARRSHGLQTRRSQRTAEGTHGRFGHAFGQEQCQVSELLADVQPCLIFYFPHISAMIIQRIPVIDYYYSKSYYLA